jgi:uncharacterized membrane protein
MDSPHAYDKAKYHYETVEGYGLSRDHASNHTVFFLRWLIEHDLLDQSFADESASILEQFRAGTATIHDVYKWSDCCLINDMLSEEGNKFAMHYFDFDVGKYLQDYAKTLQGELPSELHVPYTEENYQRMKPVIDRRYREWKSPRKWWWPF